MKPTALVLLALLAPGCVGEKGDPGPQGPPGATDTEAQVLEKVNQALAAGGSLDLQRSAVVARIEDLFSVPPQAYMAVPYTTADLGFPTIYPPYDKLGEYDSAQRRFTATRAGEYLVCAGLASWLGDSSWRLDTFINGAPDKSFSGAADVGSGCAQIHLDAMDVLEVRVFQWTSGPVEFSLGTNVCWLRIHRVG